MRAINAAWVAVIFVGLAWFNEALATDEVPMISLDQFLARADNPLHRAQFLAMRCAAVHLTWALAISADAKSKPRKDSLMETAGRFILKAQLIQQKVAPYNAEIEGGFVMGNVHKMEELYVERAVNARARTGNISDDPIIRADMKVCSELIAAL